MRSPLEKVLHSQLAFDVLLFADFHVFSFFSSCCLHLNVSSYEVATTDCPRAPCNKLLN